MHYFLLQNHFLGRSSNLELISAPLHSKDTTILHTCFKRLVRDARRLVNRLVLYYMRQGPLKNRTLENPLLSRPSSHARKKMPPLLVEPHTGTSLLPCTLFKVSFNTTNEIRYNLPSIERSFSEHYWT